jgi:dihydroneopterin aldolase
LFLSGIREQGHHGARPGEQEDPQPFAVDLDLDVALSGADTIDATADYHDICDAVRQVVREQRFDLIETMARAIAEAVLTFPHVVRARVVVHKPEAARRLEIDGVAAAVTVPEETE